MPSLPSFVGEEWYRDPRDHRCPHDAWLESVEMSEPADGLRKERRRTSIKVTLLGAYHDGEIVFRYTGVSAYSFTSTQCTRGLGDWLTDEMEHAPDGSLIHKISWRGFGPDSGPHWRIEAQDVTYEWIPRPANQPVETTRGTQP